jgi:2',3'-cyclic-nucleotide 2'-phosphodiesterase (5'-nucleotidase family)
MYELMPFDNMVTIIGVTGNVLHHFCDHMAGLGGWPVSGMSFAIKDKKAVNILVNGKQLEEEALYKLAISDYIANGGDNCDFLETAKQQSTDILIRDALIEYVSNLTTQNKALHPSLENRVQYAQ